MRSRDVEQPKLLQGLSEARSRAWSLYSELVVLVDFAEAEAHETSALELMLRRVGAAATSTGDLDRTLDEVRLECELELGLHVADEPAAAECAAFVSRVSRGAA